MLVQCNTPVDVASRVGGIHEPSHNTRFEWRILGIEGGHEEGRAMRLSQYAEEPRRRHMGCGNHVRLSRTRR